MSPEAIKSAVQPTSRRRSGLIAVVAVALIALTIAGTGVFSREQAITRMRETALERAVHTVRAAPPSVRAGGVAIDLPGRLEPYSRAALFARVSGYISSWKADIGARVKAGDVLAEIEAPDLDQQLAQARSDLATAEVNAHMAAVTNQRYQQLLPNSTVSRQTADEKEADYNAKQALMRSAQANVARLQALTEYKRIVAPFDGVVTARNTDVGALINAGSTSGSELFVVSDISRLRLYVSIPQNYVPSIKAGTNATVTTPERPGKTFAANVEATSGAVEVASGTMRTQLVVKNEGGELLPGAYASVRFDIASTGEILSVPVSSVIFDKGGLRIATVNDAGIVSLKSIKISRDLGNNIEIATGLSQADRVIESPPDDIIDGDRVLVQNRDATPQPRASK